MPSDKKLSYKQSQAPHSYFITENLSSWPSLLKFLFLTKPSEYHYPHAAFPCRRKYEVGVWSRETQPKPQLKHTWGWMCVQDPRASELSDEHFWWISPHCSLKHHFLSFSTLFYPRRLTCMEHVKGLPCPLVSSRVSANWGWLRVKQQKTASESISPGSVPASNEPCFHLPKTYPKALSTQLSSWLW